MGVPASAQGRIRNFQDGFPFRLFLQTEVLGFWRQQCEFGDGEVPRIAHSEMVRLYLRLQLAWDATLICVSNGAQGLL